MTKFPRTAFILGAGLGTRLRPLTENCPKPLLPLGDKPMVFNALEKLEKAGVRRFIINTHHCPEKWKQIFPDKKWGEATVELVYEPTLLDTGGGLANIARLLQPEDEPLIIWNGDILSGCDIQKAVVHHLANQADVTLIVREDGPNKNVCITDDGLITDLRHRLGKKDPLYQYTGICIVSQKFVQQVPAATESLVESFLRTLEKNPETIQGFLDTSPQWHDLGTIEEYQSLKAEWEKPVRGAITAEQAAQQLGYHLIEGSTEPKGGSGRRYHRLQKDSGETAILCLYDDSRPENLLYGKLAQTLKKSGIAVPDVLVENDPQGILLLEDLGTTDLWTLAQQTTFPWLEYASAISEVAKLHQLTPEVIRSSAITLMEPFDEKLYTWEHHYFTDNVLAGKKPDREMQKEMSSLTKVLLAQPPVLIHRDFQSQNILIRNQKAWLIDFQGARGGCAFYDYASLAFDPYLQRPDIDCWRIEIEDQAREASGWKGSLDEFSQLLYTAATQRLLQACGAYAFLGHKKGRADFLAHLPRGLRNLQQAASFCGKRRIADCAEEMLAKLKPSR